MTKKPELPVTYNGGCHCGAVKFQVVVRKLEAIDCNCSIMTYHN